MSLASQTTAVSIMALNTNTFFIIVLILTILYSLIKVFRR
jgi:hypothetical protein